MDRFCLVSIANLDGTFTLQMQKNAHGEYVKYSDVKKLEALAVIMRAEEAKKKEHQEEQKEIMTKPVVKENKLYILQNDNSITLSAYPVASPLFEANHINLRDEYNPYHASSEGIRNTLTNILRDAGIEFVEE